MKVLVTGAKGLLGSELCKQLVQKGDTVHAVDNLSRGNATVDCERFFNLDLTNTDCLGELDTDYNIIYHYAAINGTTNFYKKPNDVLRSNTLIDFNVFDFASSLLSDPLVVYASSSEIVVNNTDKKLEESINILINDITNPRWSYRLAKISAENYLTNSNLKYLILRYFNVYGLHSNTGHFVADQIEKIKNNVFSLIGPYETRSFCHVSDAIDATIHCAKSASYDIVNIGNDEEIRIKSAANIIAKSLGINTSLVDWEYLDSRKGSTKNRCPDINKLKNLYPEYEPLSFEEGMIKLIAAKK